MPLTMSGPPTFLLVALIAPLAWAQPAPPALNGAPSSPAPAAAPSQPPAAATPRAPELSDLLRTRIEQVKRGNRVSEIRVTGVGGEVRYTMDVGEGRPPEPRQTPGSGVSTPNFLNIEF
jgi:hypothetical protein